jgi:hypothetical protein
VEDYQLEEDKKNATRLGAHLIFIDELGFMQPYDEKRCNAEISMNVA